MTYVAKPRPTRAVYVAIDRRCGHVMRQTIAAALPAALAGEGQAPTAEVALRTWLTGQKAHQIIAFATLAEYRQWWNEKSVPDVARCRHDPIPAPELAPEYRPTGDEPRADDR